MFIVIFYFIISVVTYITYAMDKSAAEQNRWRIQENTLHMLALVGGWPGALIAQRTLRHKTQKISFQIVYWATVGFNLAGLFWILLNPDLNKLMF
ncbi:MAG: DUF1294 domain-containing protein [Gammaproteobacteria bacterium]|uniref:DUF1294 domain-containing protein n=1 Tax=Tolumonas auensis TaxID=43948 RepID=UPI002AA81386|nr:DUF1294 domain-containing protein [Tolumonas auensis]NCB58288.1 DUF1294 domain-containing protein [Gammaproteobacteria bacterium]